MSILSIKEIHKKRGHGVRSVPVLRGINLSIERGEIVLLEGPSGSGKTTLLALAAGLLMPDAGEVLLGGVSLADLTPAARRSFRAQQVGFVFQRSNLMSALTVRQNVLLMTEVAAIPSKVGKKETDALLHHLGLTTLAHRYPHELSGGEEQRTAIARALVHRPKIVFADEPTGSLDGDSGRAVAEALAGLARDRDTAVLVATHDLRLEPIATRKIRLSDGLISE